MQGNPAIFIEANIHAREWISSAAATWIINELLSSDDPTTREIANTIDWYILPVANPDGFIFSHESVSLCKSCLLHTQYVHRTMPIPCHYYITKVANDTNVFRLVYGEKLANHGDHALVQTQTETLTFSGCVRIKKLKELKAKNNIAF